MRRAPIKLKAKKHTISDFFLKIRKNKLSLYGVSAIIVGLVLVMISATMHPLVLSHITQDTQVYVTNDAKNAASFQFGSYPALNTTVTFGIPSGSSLHYVLYKVQYRQLAPHDFVATYSYVSQGNVTSNGQQIIIPSTVSSITYQLNLTTAGSSFPASVSALILVPTHAPTDVRVEIAGLAIFGSGAVAIIIWITFNFSKNEYRGTKDH